MSLVIGQDRQTFGHALVPVLAVALLATAVRLVYLVYLCPYDLVEDEAFYWEWSLHMDWSYATKGPGIAWAIWLSTNLLGTSEAAVRAVAAVAAGISTLAVGALAADVAAYTHKGSQGRASPVRVGVVAGLLWNATPVFAGIGIFSTIDGPYIACWAVAAWSAWRAIVLRSPIAWVVLGLAIGVGFLFKYTILLLPPGLLLFVLLSRGYLRLGVRGRAVWPWALLAGAVAVVGLLPVLIWNSQHDWQTVRHLLGHMGFAGGDVAPHRPGAGQRFPLQWFLELLAAQAGMLITVIVPVVASTIWGTRRGGAPFDRPLGVRYLLLAAGPILLLYALVSLITKPQANWPIGAYVTLIPLAALWMTDPDEPVGLRRFARNAAIVGGLLTALILARADLARSAVSLVSPALAQRIPLGRLMGAREMGQDVHDRLQGLRAQTGLEPFVVTIQYGRASRVRFYLPGRPTTFCASSKVGGRIVQQDYWPEADLSSPALLGRPALIVGGSADGSTWARAFARIEPGPRLAGEGKAEMPVFIGYGFKGFQPTNHP